MVLYEVHRQSQYTQYYSTLCSRATLFQFIVTIIIILAPFFIAYSTNDFWQRTSTYIEQPQVHFLNRWIVQVSVEDSAMPKSWSTYQGLNRLLTKNTKAIPIVKFREDDYSFDQIKDKLVLSIEYADQQSDVLAVDIILFFELQFSLMADVTVHSAVHISSAWPIPSSRLWVSGDLLLYQKTPLPSTGRVTTYNTTFFNDSSILAVDYELTNILRTIQKQNVSTVLGNSYSVWRSGGGDGSFSVELELTYPKQTVVYIPGFWQVVKFAWIQYLALLVIFWCILGGVRNFVFQNQIILTVKKKYSNSKIE